MGGNIENRCRFPLRILKGIKKRWVKNLLLFTAFLCWI